MAERRRTGSAPVRQDDAYYASKCCETVTQLKRDLAGIARLEKSA